VDRGRRIIFGTNANKFHDEKGKAGQQAISAQLGVSFPRSQNLPSFPCPTLEARLFIRLTTCKVTVGWIVHGLTPRVDADEG
jgi:hypothetical protein